MKLLYLDINNFKGIKSLHLDLDGQSASIFGDNATGKTSIYDAFLWLLFGKDSTGAADFSIKPIVNGQEIHNTDTSVEAMLNGIKLKRVYREVWTRRRGDAEDSFAGHSTLYFVDDLPTSMGNFKKAVEGIMPETLFRILTNPFFFPETMKWQDRRTQLFKLFGGISDEDVAATDEAYAGLLEMAGRHTIEEYMMALKSKIRGYNTTLKELPARMDEVSRQIIEDDDESEAESIVESLAQEIQALKSAIDSTDDQELVDQKTAVDNEIIQLQNANNAYRERLRIQNLEIRRVNINDIMAEIKKLKIPSLQAHAEHEAQLEADLGHKLDDLRKKFTEVASEVFAVQDKCPCCGRPFAKEDIESAKLAWEEHRKERLDEINAEGQRLSALRKNAADFAKEAYEELERKTKLADQYEADIERLRTAEPTQDSDGYAQRMESLTKKREAILDAITKAREGHADKVKALAEQMAEKRVAYIASKNALATIKASQAARIRMEELRAQRLEVVGALEDAEGTVELCEEFIRARIRMVEESINRHFDIVEWKLYREQINGGLEEICEASVNGVPFHDLNGAMRINAGLDIIYACMQATEQSAPIFIDNAESVTELYENDTAQIIRLVVSADDKHLRVQK